MSDDDEETPLEEFVGGVVVAGILLVAFGLLAVGYPWFWVAFPVGFGGVLPAAIALARLYERRREERAADEAPTEQEAALSTLRDRYARGELTEAEFERKVERLLETETVADAREFGRRGGSSGEHDDGPHDAARDREEAVESEAARDREATVESETDREETR